MYSVNMAGAMGSGVASGMLATQMFPLIGIESRVPSVLVGLAIVLAGYAIIHRRSTRELTP